MTKIIITSDDTHLNLDINTHETIGGVEFKVTSMKMDSSPRIPLMKATPLFEAELVDLETWKKSIEVKE